MFFDVRPTFPGRRRNSPRADTLCTDLHRLTSLPPALFVANEAAITVTVDGGSPIPVRALIGIGSDDQFSTDIFLVAHIPGLGLVERCHIMDLEASVGDAVNYCALVFASSLANRMMDYNVHGDVQVLDHAGELLASSSY